MIENELTKKAVGDQNADYEIKKAQLKNAETYYDNFNNPAVNYLCSVLKAVLPVASFGDLMETSIKGALEDNIRKNRKQLLDIILSDNQVITLEKVNDVEFIVNFARVMDAVNRLARNDKVEYFANLIKNGYLSKSTSTISNDEFEEYYYEISTLSFRELEYLAFFWKFAENHDGEIQAHLWKSFSEKFEEKFTDQDPRSVYRRLIKTGFIYERKFGSFASKSAIELHLDNEGFGIDKGFKRFYEIVLDSDYR